MQIDILIFNKRRELIIIATFCFRTMTDSICDLKKHQRRVGLVLWHPSAQNILLSAGSDNQVVIWNVGTAQALKSFMLPDLVYSGCWNWDGSEVRRR